MFFKFDFSYFVVMQIETFLFLMLSFNVKEEFVLVAADLTAEMVGLDNCV